MRKMKCQHSVTQTGVTEAKGFRRVKPTQTRTLWQCSICIWVLTDQMILWKIINYSGLQFLARGSNFLDINYH